MVDRSDEGGDPACWLHLFEEEDDDGDVGAADAGAHDAPAPGEGTAATGSPG